MLKFWDTVHREIPQAQQQMWQKPGWNLISTIRLPSRSFSALQALFHDVFTSFPFIIWACWFSSNHKYFLNRIENCQIGLSQKKRSSSETLLDCPQSHSRKIAESPQRFNILPVGSLGKHSRAAPVIVVIIVPSLSLGTSLLYTFSLLFLFVLAKMPVILLPRLYTAPQGQELIQLQPFYAG